MRVHGIVRKSTVTALASVYQSIINILGLGSTTVLEYAQYVIHEAEYPTNPIQWSHDPGRYSVLYGTS
jgi:hypothetical protein